VRGSGEVVGRRSRRGVGGAAVLVGGVLTMFASAVQADTYQCTTEDGRKLSAATRPVECDSRPTHRIRSNGSVEELEPNPAPGHLRKGEDEAKPKNEGLEGARERMRHGIWLLDRYKNEAEIDAARDRDLAARQRRVVAARKSIEDLQRERKKLDDEAEFHRKGLPAELKSALEANDLKIKTQERIVLESLDEMENVNKRYDADAQLFRELTKPRKPPVRPPLGGK